MGLGEAYSYILVVCSSGCLNGSALSRGSFKMSVYLRRANLHPGYQSWEYSSRAPFFFVGEWGVREDKQLRLLYYATHLSVLYRSLS